MLGPPWLLFCACLVLLLSAPARAASVALVADIQGAIGPATSRFVQTVVDMASAREAQLVILRMDTPGGLSDSMREIIKTILASPVPVATFVAPSGARAASAGTYILYASHVAAMAPGTNLGAATPVQIGEGLPLPTRKPDDPTADEPDAEPAGDVMQSKAINDAAAYIRGLAELRGRNAEWAERAVREAASLPATEALEFGVIDLVVADVPALLKAVDGREVDVRGSIRTLQGSGLAVETVEPSWQLKLLAIITNPNLAFLLMMVGIYGLIFEFSNPGSIGPGVLGVICLLLGLYALNMLPLDLTGLALLLLGVAFMVAEAFTPAFGVLGIGGLVAFVLGASLLLDSDSPYFRLSIEMIAATAITSAVLLILVLGYALRAQRRPVTTGVVELLEVSATVIEWDGGDGYVQVRGERWRARGEHDLHAGDRVQVTAVHGLVLDVSNTGAAPKGENT